MSVTSCWLNHSTIELKKVQVLNFLCSKDPVSNLTDRDVFGNAFEWNWGNNVYLKTAVSVCQFLVALGRNAVKCLCRAGLDNGCRDR